MAKLAFPGAEVSRVGSKYNGRVDKGVRKTVGALSERLDDGAHIRSDNTCCLCVA